MPQLHKGRWGYTYEEFVCRRLSMAAMVQEIGRAKDTDKGLKVLRRACRNNVALIDVESVSQEDLDFLGDPRQIMHPLEKHFTQSSEVRRLLSQYRFENGSYLAIEHQDRIIINAATLQACITLRSTIERDRKRRGENLFKIDEELLRQVISFNVTLNAKHRCQHTLPQSPRRFKEVLNGFEKRGYISLISGKYGNDNSRKVTANTISLLKSLFVSDISKPSPTEVHRLYIDFLTGKIEVVNSDTGELYEPKSFKGLSDSTVKEYLTSWDVEIGTSLIRQGDRQKWMGAHKPTVSFEKTKYAGSIISVDDRQPAMVMPDGKRIWLYVAIDVASEAYVCIVHGKTKDGIIKEFYRQMVRNFAEWTGTMPDGLECESSLNSQFLNSFLANGAMFGNVRVARNNAREKIIEHFNRRMRYEIEKKEGTLQARPFARLESNQAGTREIKPMHYDEIVRLCFKNYEDWNMAPHSIHTHLSRWEVFMQMQHPDLKPINYNAILPHLGQKTETSCNVGAIRLRGGQYWLGENNEIALGERLINLMRRVEGREVTIYWLDDNEGKILKALVFIGSVLMCEAIVKPTIPRAKNEEKPDHGVIKKLVHSYITTVEAYARKSKNEIERVTVINNIPPMKRTFVMPGLHRHEAKQMPTGVMMPEPEELSYDKLPKQNFNRSLKDTF